MAESTDSAFYALEQGVAVSLASQVNSAPGDTGIVASAPSSHFLRGIDTLRFVAACWVVLYHGVAPPLNELVSPRWNALAIALAKLPFNGSAAVVLFFVISGFCIHLGNVSRPRLNAKRFLAQRFIRIIPPLIAIIGIANILGAPYRNSLNSVLWSVYCELIYYALYPVFFYFLRGTSLIWFISASVAVAIAIAAASPETVFLWGLGRLTALYCLPMWLIGCLFAEVYSKGGIKPPIININILRCGAIGYGALASVLAHLNQYPITLIWTMPVFAVFCPFWIWNEILLAQRGKVSLTLERFGLASYSVYLVHKLAIVAVIDMGLAWYVAWPAKMLGVVLLTIAFYFAVERPSHIVSKRAGRLFQNVPMTSAGAV